MDKLQIEIEADARKLDQERRELWKAVAIAVARNPSTKVYGGPGTWADRTLQMFDATFKAKP